MTTTFDIRSLLAKALRIVLVFMLVFWSSLHVEYLAFGADDEFPTVTADDGVAHDEAGDTLVDLVVYEQVEDEQVEGGKWKPVPHASAKAVETEKNGQSGEIEQATIALAVGSDAEKAGTRNFVVVPVWLEAASASDEGEAEGGASGEAEEQASKQEAEPAYPDGYEKNGELDAVTAATFVKADLDPVGEGALVAVSPNAKGVFSVTPVKNGEGTLTFKLVEPRTEKLSVAVKTVVSGITETRDIKDATATFAEGKDNVPYTGEAIDAELDVTYADEALKAGADYEVEYEAADDAKLSKDGKPLEVGSYKVSIKGIGSYTGTKAIEGSFVIEPAGKGLPMEKAVIEKISDQTYTGSEITPEIVVKYTEEGQDETTLKLGEDYTVKYENNIGSVTESTKATATVTGKGDYTGTKTAEFTILPPKPELEYVELAYATEGGQLVLSADGSELVPVDETLTFEDGGSLDYQFSAKVKMTYDIRQYTLAEAKDKFSDLNLQYKWKVADEGSTAEGESAGDSSQAASESGGATIDQQGLLHVTKRGKYKVTCEVMIDIEDDGPSGDDAGKAESSSSENPGSESASQTSADADSDSGSVGSESENESTGSSASSSSSAPPSDSGASVGTQAAGDESGSAANASTQTVSDSITVNVGGVDDPQGFSRPQPSLQVTAGIGTIASSADDSAGSPVIDKTYTDAQLAALANQVRLFNMTASGKSVAITGQGLLLLDLLKDAYADSGQDVSTLPIESVSFENYKGTAKTVPWTFLSNASTTPFVALNSYVHDASESASTPADASKLVPNTRFRLLFDYSSSLSSENQNADDYRWLKAIRVNYKTTESDNLTVGISYTPVPKGVYAEFVAVPNHMINGKWDCMWEVCPKAQQSSDGKPLSWTQIEGETGQTLRVMTSDDTIGNLYRVTIDNNTNLTTGEKNKELVATSDPEELREGAGIVLSYNPPRAGDMAIFKSSIYNYSGDVSKLEYVWEWSDNGGVSWNELKGEKKSTLKIPTEPVTDDGSASDGTTPTLVYIRVRAIPPKGDPMVSNAQPLTVHVGEDNSDAGGDDKDGKTDADSQKQGGETEKSDPKKEKTPADTSKSEPREIDSIQLDFTDVSDDYDDDYDYESDTTAALDPAGSSIPEVLINESVNEKVAQQEQAQQEYMEANTPGARWTQLNTLEPSGDDISRVLDGNPLAPLVIPVGLGVTAAGGVEKLVAFRRQLGKPLASLRANLKSRKSVS